MRSKVRSISALGAVFFAAIGIAACGGGIPGNAVVAVNGSPITKSTFEHWVKIAATSSATPGSTPVVPVPPNYTACIAHLRAAAPKPAKGQSVPSEAQLKAQCEQQYSSYKNSALAFLIQAKWILGQAEEMNISVTNQEVEKTFNKLKKQSFPKESDYKKFLARTGFTTSDLELRIKLQSLLAPKIERQVSKEGKTDVSHAEAANYYKAHSSLYGKPERRNLLILLTKTEAQAKSAKAEIQSGKSFSSVAKARSIDPGSKASGGELPEVQRGQQEKALNDAVFAAQVKTLSGPVKTPFGYYVFEVTKVLPPTQQPLSKVEAAIKQQLGAERSQKHLSSFVKEFKKRWSAKTECRPQYMVELCSGYKRPRPVTPQSTTPQPTTPQTTAPKTTSSSTTASKTK